MNKLGLLFAVLSVVFGLSLMTAPAFAQSQRTWVSAAGDDTNPCSPMQPCKSFAGALSKTAPGGVLSCAGSGAFGPMTITKSVSIICDGIIGGISVGNNGNGIIINGPGINVLISGLDIDGFGKGLTGIQIREAASVIIRRTSIRNFLQRGVDFQGTNGNAVSILDSSITGSALAGFFMQGQSSVTNDAIIERTYFTLNAGGSVQVVGPGVTFISDTTSADSVSLNISGGAIVFSYGTNIFLGTGSPTQVLQRQ